MWWTVWHWCTLLPSYLQRWATVDRPELEDTGWELVAWNHSTHPTVILPFFSYPPSICFGGDFSFFIFFLLSCLLQIKQTLTFRLDLGLLFVKHHSLFLLIWIFIKLFIFSFPVAHIDLSTFLQTGVVSCDFQLLRNCKNGQWTHLQCFPLMTYLLYSVKRVVRHSYKLVLDASAQLHSESER